MLAARSAPVSILIFDEADTGVGGAVAAVIGELMQRLAAESQVLCVTHLPQVAARADHHLKVLNDALGAFGLQPGGTAGRGRPAGRDRPDAGWQEDHRHDPGPCGRAAGGQPALITAAARMFDSTHPMIRTVLLTAVSHT